MSAPLYLVVDAAVVSVPLLFTWHPRIRFDRHWRAFWPACLTVLIPFIAWDVFFAKAGVWGFDQRYLLGPSLFELPLEEWLFFICIPYACVFTYHALGSGRDRTAGDNSPAFTRRTQLFLVTAATICLLMALLNLSRPYTSTVTGLCALFLFALVFVRPAWMGRLGVACAVLTTPFILTNGVLTGLRFWSAPVLNLNPDLIIDRIVWYDNSGNLSVRFFTIPLEDFFYTFLLVGLNVFVYEEIRRRLESRRSDGRQQAPEVSADMRNRRIS